MLTASSSGSIHCDTFEGSELNPGLHTHVMTIEVLRELLSACGVTKLTHSVVPTSHPWVPSAQTAAVGSKVGSSVGIAEGASVTTITEAFGSNVGEDVGCSVGAAVVLATHLLRLLGIGSNPAKQPHSNCCAPFASDIKHTVESVSQPWFPSVQAFECVGSLDGTLVGVGVGVLDG